MGSVSVDRRFNGPTDSGNGVYSCGLFAQLVPGPAAVELRSPVPLATELVAEPERQTGELQITDAGALVATAKPAAALELELPEAPTLEQARVASRSYRAPSGGLFGCCFVCGPDRDDALGVFAGSVDDRSLVSSPWTPRESATDPSGSVREEMIWAVLDCPTYFALYPDEGDGLPMSFLARMQAEVVQPLQAGTEYVVAAWPIERDGRKLHAGSSVFDAVGSVLAFARVLLIESRAPASEPR